MRGIMRHGIAAWIVCVAITAMAGSAHARGHNGLGLVAGAETGPNDFFLGGQAEMGPVLGSSFVVPSFHFTLGEASTGVANVDLRWYLLPLPETGIRIYGSAGPTVVFASETDIGLSLSAGFNIPMKKNRRYNVEFRWGIGDIPDFKIGAAVMFAL